MNVKELKEKSNKLGYPTWIFGDIIGIYRIIDDKLTEDLVVITRGNPGFSFQTAFFRLTDKEQNDLREIVNEFLDSMVKAKNKDYRGQSELR